MARLLEFRPGIRVAGHPLHAMLAHFPMAFWMLVFPCEFLAWIGGWHECRRLAFWANAAGLVAATPATLTGLLDLSGLSGRTRAAAASKHLYFMLAAAFFFGACFYLDSGERTEKGLPVLLNLGLSLAGTAFLVCGGWWGGELVFRHGAGQERAHSNASASLPAETAS